jgi:hypothetical protein
LAAQAREVQAMLSKSERRLAKWSDKIQKWADVRIEEFGSESKDGQYAFGVSMGIAIAKGKMTQPKNMKKRYKPQAIRGLEDCKWLMSKAVKYGDAPAGPFLELLQAPRMEPVSGTWSRRDSPD